MWPLNFGRQRTSLHRIGQNHWLREWCAPLAPKTVINLGAEPEAVDKEGRTYRDYFPDAQFRALDQRPHDHPDYVEGNLMEPMTHLGQFDLVILMSVIEHIDRPWIAAPHISDLIAPGGHLFIAMPWFYPTHEGPDFGDHWRARPSGISVLFDNLSLVQEAYFKSPILAVRDRGKYWRNRNSTATGSALLYRKEG